MASAVSLLVLHVLVSGSDPATEDHVRRALFGVPECLRESLDGAIEIRITPGMVDAQYVPPDKKTVQLAIANGRLVDHHFKVTDNMLDESRRHADEATLEPRVCAAPGELSSLFGNLERAILHEVAHSYHYDHDRRRGPRMRHVVDKFLDLRWRQLYEQWDEDPERKRIHDEYRAAQQRVADRQKRGEQPTPQELEDVCALRKELEAKYGRMPRRVPGDFHAFTRANGTEYFAMAIETLVHQHDQFCRNYSPEEIAFLKDFLGFCLAQLKNRAACYDAMPAANVNAPPAPGAGTRRD